MFDLSFVKLLNYIHFFMNSQKSLKSIDKVCHVPADLHTPTSLGVVFDLKSYIGDPEKIFEVDRVLLKL